MTTNKKLWHGLTLVFTVCLSLFITVALTLEQFSSTIDDYFNTHSSVMVSEDDGTLYSAYTPDEAFLNADGSGNSKAVIQRAVEIGTQLSVEGSVLLKNNGALPLASKSSITLLGLRSYAPILGSEMGVKVQGPAVTLATALSQTTTDLRNTPNTSSASDVANFDEYDFEGPQYKINPTMEAVYEKLNETYEFGYNDGEDTTHNGHASLGEAKYNNGVATTLVDNYDPCEPSVAEYKDVNADYASSFATYGDAAIVVLSRPGQEQYDYQKGGVAEGTGASEPLELTTNERDVIELATTNFDKVIVLVNTTSAMEIRELEDNDKIDAIVWIGFPGCYGMIGVAQLLCGMENFSGKMVDTYATYNLSAPAMMNMGDYQYSNATNLTNSNSYKYVIEAEGIYTGYHYYETRYYDSVLNQGNAISKSGVYASEGNWDYNAEMTYTFGYGMSYTTFTQEITSYNVNYDSAHDINVDINVKVKNTGSTAGMCVVQVYGQAPYITGGVEKSAIQLLNYDKTATLAAGEETEITINIDLQNIASWDSSANSGNGSYILDEGEYYFSLGTTNDNDSTHTGSHAALNNVLAAQGYTTDNSTVIDYSGSTDAVVCWTYDYAGEGTVDSTTFAITKNSTAVSNSLEYADWNYYESGKITYLSRSDWYGTYPIEYNDLAYTSSMENDLNGLYYEVQTEDDTSSVVWGSTDTDYKFYELAGSDYDDYRWDDLLNQVTIEEAMYMAVFGGPVFPGMPSVGFEEITLTENNGNGIVKTFAQSLIPDATPWKISSDDNNAAWNGQVFAASPVIASSWNPSLYYDLGEFVGEESLFIGYPIIWGPGLNTHRQAYNGRNCEYYSEDGVLCGVIAMEYSIGALECGLIAAPKHFAFNDQETNRKGVAPYMTEQRAREIELRAYQIAIEATKYDKLRGEDVGMLGLMTSFSKIGAVECTCSVGLMTNILQNEWGFHGYAVTDIFDDTDNCSAAIYAGITGYDIRGAQNYAHTGGTSVNIGTYSRFASQLDGSTYDVGLYDGDLSMQLALKESVHRTLWTFTQSNMMNWYNSSTHIESRMTSWRWAYTGLIAGASVLAVLSLAGYVTVIVKEKKKEV